MQVFCMNYSYIFLAQKFQHKNSYMDVLVFLRVGLYDSGLCACSTSASYIQEQPIHDSGLCGQMQVFCMNYWYIFGQERPTQEEPHGRSGLFTPICILACASSLPVPAIYKNILYMILACVAKYRSSAWITGIFFGQEMPTQEQVHGLCVFYPYMHSSLCI